MSMEEEIEMLREIHDEAKMEVEIAKLTQILAAEKIIVQNAEVVLGEDHLGMIAIGAVGQQIDDLTDELGRALKNFEETVQGVIKAVIYSLEHPPQ